MSKYALAKKAKVSPQMIGYMENGERIPSLDILCRVAAGLNVRLSAILREAEDQFPTKSG